MGGDVVGADRQKGAGADVERDGGAGDADAIERLQEVGCEMQPGGGGGDRAGVGSEDGLVVGVVVGGRAGRAGDVGRQRERAGLLERAVEADRDAVAVAFEDLGLEVRVAVEAEAVAGA